MRIASLNMCDRAEIWVNNYMAYKKYIPWHEFIMDLRARIRDDNKLNVVKQFKDFTQSS